MFSFGQPSLWQRNFDEHKTSSSRIPESRSWCSEDLSASLFVQFHDLNFFNIDKVFPDSNPPISGEIFSSLRIFIPADLFSVLLPGANELVRDIGQSTIIGETSILGGLWTFMTGIFSLIFGSSLLLVIFGTPSE